MDWLVTVPGPLTGLTVVELGGIGPAPFCGMMLADLGARVVTLSRAGRNAHPVLDRGKERWTINLKDESSLVAVRGLVSEADAVIEGFRPGVAERLGIGPEQLAEFNPRLVYGRITGFGRSGPLAQRAGHDINYIALSGALGSIGRPGGRPVPPLNLVADFGGGGMLLALGVVAALLRARSTGEGEIVDAAMVDGAALLMGMVYGFHAIGRWAGETGNNLFDGGAPYYDTYTCADGRFMAVGAIEPQFFEELVRHLGIDQLVDVSRREDRAYWPELRESISAAFRTHDRDHWENVFATVDACVTPVLTMTEAAHHPHNLHRGVFHPIEGGVAPAPAPRFSPLTTHTAIPETART